MKLLIVSQAGMHPYCRAIYRELTESGEVDLTVIVPKLFYPHHVGTGVPLVLDAPVFEDGYCLLPVRLRDPQDYTRGFSFFALSRAIRTVMPDVTHVWDEARSIILMQTVVTHVMFGVGAKMVCYAFENLPLRFKLFFDPIWRIVWRRVDGITASNSEALQNLRAGGLLGKHLCSRIFWGTPLSMYRILDKKEARSGAGLDCTFVVGGVGGLLPQKGFDTLLDAVAFLPQVVHCVLIGSGPMEEFLKERASLPDLAGRVHFLGQVPSDRMVDYMNCFDVLVIPSRTTATWKEQFGKVIPEAMACGVPVIGSDSGAIPEVIGDAGLVFPEGDVEALGAAIGQLYSEPSKAAEFAERGLVRVHEELSAQAFATKHVAFYNRLLGKL